MQSYLVISEKVQHRPMISVCCICQRQRTSVDTWEPLDICRNSEENENFTHGFCPDCIREYYPKISNL